MSPLVSRMKLWASTIAGGEDWEDGLRRELSVERGDREDGEGGEGGEEEIACTSPVEKAGMGKSPGRSGMPPVPVI
jgi:hypothetical protein